MSKPFCFKCAEETFGPAAAEVVRQSVESAPPFNPQQIAALRALFASADASMASRKPVVKTCGHP